ncbi:GNAT family N-acetyltransferase [Shewanella sp. AS16]|uniref:GNAT family N-acetyltransferase n=1 Tax=Shewanella sp. AS16 TaxID=2907625 RepID=UPI001F1E0CFA|nr:GNAT family N-acetyltransferase [Shewanella sp. AS16]MCE9685768.1 GNAT family N-acetyltransferase [Shewanella sp. AS16]
MISIRKATHLDAQRCWDIRNEAILAGCEGFYEAKDLAIWTQGSLTPQFTRVVAEHFYVAELEGNVVATVMLDLPYAQLEALFVAPGYMGLGIGKRLLAFMEHRAWNLGLAGLRLESTLNAAAFYRSCGYGGDGMEEASVYRSPRGIVLDCVVMHKELGPVPKVER